LLHGTFSSWDQLRDATRIRMAGQAINTGITRLLPLVSAADKNVERDLSDWDTVLRIARMTTAELGIDPKQMANIPIQQRPDLIMQKRVQKYKLEVS
jgi:tRNA nucleotidyltransferase (CCA-adding enzyme)